MHPQVASFCSIPHPLAWHFVHDSLSQSRPHYGSGKSLQGKKETTAVNPVCPATSAMDDTSSALEEYWRKGFQKEVNWQVSDVLNLRGDPNCSSFLAPCLGNTHECICRAVLSSGTSAWDKPSLVSTSLQTAKNELTLDSQAS